MAHDDDVLDAERQHGELERRARRVMSAVRRIGGDEVRDIADDEDLTGAGIENRLGRGARIAAGDDHDRWILRSLAQPTVTFLLRRIAPAAKIRIAGEKLRRQSHGRLFHRAGRQALDDIALEEDADDDQRRDRRRRERRHRPTS